MGALLPRLGSAREQLSKEVKMKGVIEREKLQRLAQLAVAHFQEMFDERKEKTLARLADREYGLFFKKKRGMEWAEEVFARSAYDAGGSSSGQFFLGGV